jgi:WD40 repeat protein
MGESVSPGSRADVLTGSREPSRQLWAEWRRGQKPDVDAYLRKAGQLTTAQIADVLRVDQRERWRLGERPRAEDYLKRYPALEDDPEKAFDLVYNEVLLLEERGEAPDLGTCLERFPEFEVLLREQFALHEALEAESAGADDAPAADEASERTQPPATDAFRWSDRSVHGYQLLRQIGSGGMGVVYEAKQLGLLRRVALKMIQGGAHAAPEHRDRFRSEAAAAARLHHPNIVEIYEVGELDGCPYIAMEYVDGGSLAQQLSSEPQPARSAARLVQTLAGAVEHAHQHGVVHRDLKPANVLMTMAGVAKVADFGLAKCGDEDLEPTRSGTILGSPCYIAPEQAAGQVRDIGPAADVYSLGAILYEMLTGNPPFRSSTALETLQRVRTDEPTRPTRSNPGIPRDLETICLKCLEKLPVRRYGSALALAEELGRFLDGAPIQARPLRAPARLWRWCRRKPALAGALGFAVLALLTTVAVSLTFAVSQYAASARLAAALHQVQARGREVDRLAADMAYDHGQTLCEQGDAGQGMLWMSRGLASAARAGAEDLQRALRANLAAWLQELHVLTARWEASAPVMAVAISPDGRFALSAADDGLAQFWDFETGEEAGPSLQHPATVTSLAFSPDGKTVLTGCTNSFARLWDVATRRPVGPPLKHPMAVSSVAFSPDGKTVLTGSWDRRARLWDVGTSTPIGQPMEHRDRVSSVAFSLDGRKIATGSWDGTARLWDARTGTPLGKPLSHADFVWSVAFSPDGRRLMTACFDRKAWLWDTATGQPVGQPLLHQHCVSVAAFSPDGRTVLTGCQDATARLWDAETAELVGTSVRHRHSITSALFHPDGKAVLTAGLDKSVMLWKVARPAKATFAHQGYIRRAVFSPDGSAILSGSVDATARVWDSTTGRPLSPPLRHEGSVQAVAFSPDSQTVVTGSDDRTARLWNAHTGAARGQPMRHEDKVWSLAVSPNGKALLTASWDNTARLWETRLGNPLGPPLRHDGPLSVVAFTPDGRTMFTGGWDMIVRQWDVASGRATAYPLRHHGAIRALAVSPDGGTVLTGSYDRTAQLWDRVTGKPIGPATHHQGQVWFVGFSPDGQTVLSGGQDTVARIRRLPPPLDGEPYQIQRLIQDQTGMELRQDGPLDLTGVSSN